MTLQEWTNYVFKLESCKTAQENQNDTYYKWSLVGQIISNSFLITHQAGK